jgi:hypothetical protein
METEGTITKELLDAWKKADDYVGVRIEDGKATINLSAKVKAPKGYENTYDNSVRVSFNSFPAYVNGHKTGKAYFADARYTFVSDNWDALRMILRVGDKVTFNADENNNQYMRDAGLHNDQLYVSVIRNDKQILSRFVIRSSQCPDNSARAIR